MVVELIAVLRIEHASEADVTICRSRRLEPGRPLPRPMVLSMSENRYVSRVVEDAIVAAVARGPAFTVLPCPGWGREYLQLIPLLNESSLVKGYACNSASVFLSLGSAH